MNDMDQCTTHSSETRVTKSWYNVRVPHLRLTSERAALAQDSRQAEVRSIARLAAGRRRRDVIAEDDGADGALVVGVAVDVDGALRARARRKRHGVCARRRTAELLRLEGEARARLTERARSLQTRHLSLQSGTARTLRPRHDVTSSHPETILVNTANPTKVHEILIQCSYYSTYTCMFVANAFNIAVHVGNVSSVHSSLTPSIDVVNLSITTSNRSAIARMMVICHEQQVYPPPRN